jgi:5-methyltetrahydropteroyltriglutamate--homocysteine methyltransferase
MQRSTDPILTTHTGSLPRPDDLASLLEGRDQRAAQADPGVQARLADAVTQTVRKQLDAGVVVNDGEMSKVGYATYVTDRLTGFADQNGPAFPSVEAGLFPAYYRERIVSRMMTLHRPACVGPIAWRGNAQVQADLANLRAALAGVAAVEAFITAASPGVVWQFLANEHYPTHEAYVFAVADAMRHEYEAIVNAGFILQLDCPELALGWNGHAFKDATIDDFREVVELHVAALNHAIANIPADRVRLHLCWGNIEAPHVRDIPLASILDLVLKANVGAISFEAANPRHAHEWRVFEDVKLPEGKILIPGVLDSTTNFVEHPELVAERIVRYARLVGRENVIAGSDCGFSSFARSATKVHPTVTWAKLQALAEGARIATDHLWA